MLVYQNSQKKENELTIQRRSDVLVKELICRRPNVVCLVNLKRLGSKHDGKKMMKLNQLVVKAFEPSNHLYLAIMK